MTQSATQTKHEAVLTPQQIVNLEWMTGLSGRQFGQVVGVEEITVNRWESGQCIPTGRRQVRRLETLWSSIMDLSDEDSRQLYLEMSVLEKNELVPFWRRRLAAWLKERRQARNVGG